MGSTLTLIRQSLILAVLMAVMVVVSPSDSRTWVAAASVVALIFFITISLLRHREINRLAMEVDEVLHTGRQIDFSNYREGDVAVLENELAKMVANLARTRDQLAHEKNALADALADISHQIRTPLTAITLMLPMIEDAGDATERKRYTRKLESMLERVSWLVTTLLKIAKVDAGAMHVEHQLAKAEDVVRNAIAPLETTMDLREVVACLKLDSDTTFEGDANWTAEAIENIVKNCIEQTPAGGTVTIDANEDAIATSIIITDTGPGISPEDLPHVFERFYRGKTAQPSPVEFLTNENVDSSENASTATTHSFAETRDPTGFGIGLSLAQALVSAQGGTLSASNSSDGGAQFKITFPKMTL